MRSGDPGTIVAVLRALGPATNANPGNRVRGDQHSELLERAPLCGELAAPNAGILPGRFEGVSSEVGFLWRRACQPRISAKARRPAELLERGRIRSEGLNQPVSLATDSSRQVSVDQRDRYT